MRKKLNAIINTPDLPPGFTECEYLESTATQYINSLVYPDNETGAQVSYQITEKTDYMPCGAFYSSSPRLSMYMPRNNSLGAPVANWGSMQFLVDEFSERCTYSKKITSMNFLNDRKAYIKCPEYGEETRPVGLWTQPKIDLPLGLFCCLNQTGLASFRYYGRIFETKMSQGDALVRYFVPALDENNTPCMYDLISREPFYNQGKGTFGYKIKATGETVAPVKG